MLGRRLSTGQHRQAVLTLWVLFGLVVSACTSEGVVGGEDLTEGAVERAWAEAAECLADEGYSVETQRNGLEWAVAFDGAPEETNWFSRLNFSRIYDGCVGEAEEINRAFLITQIPEGAERLEMATEFRTCLKNAGVEEPNAYDPNNPDQVVVLADAIEQLGYDHDGDYGDDPPWPEDPRFRDVLTCLTTYELLFPRRFES